MIYTGATAVECVNKNHSWYHPGLFRHQDAKIAALINRHIVLTADQIKYCGFSTRRLGHMVKFGFLYRYRLLNGDITLPSVFAIGRAASQYLGYPIVRINNPQKVQSMIAVNQVLINLLCHLPESDIVTTFHRWVQAVFTYKNPLGIAAPRNGFDPSILARNNVDQAVIILPTSNHARPDLPVRYVFDEEINNPFEISYYSYSIRGLERVNLFAEPAIN